MKDVRPKKYLGQHFLCDDGIAQRIVESLQTPNPNVLEIGPGMGVLTKFLIHKENVSLKVVEIDDESVAYLQQNYPELLDKIIAADFLTLDLSGMYSEKVSIIGNFPYNISSQILFKILENKDLVTEVVGMFQKEVAERIASAPGNKHYGILSVLLQAYYDIEYLFTVHEGSFNPPPKVKSAVIRITRNPEKKLGCDEKLFKQVVKTAFNQRRKTLRNSLKTYQFKGCFSENPLFTKRPEQLTVGEFETICSNVCQHNTELQRHIEQEIIPLYDHFDKAHQRDHVRMVIRQSMDLASQMDVNLDMVYAIAAYHDIGLCEGREHHHKVSARMLLADAELRKWFQENELKVMAEAVEDHRASSDHTPRSIYGRIVAEADRFIEPDTILRRTVQYGMKHYPQLDKEGHYKRMLQHLHEKYGRNGYLRLWFDHSPNAARLEKLRQMMEDETLLRQKFETIFPEELIDSYDNKHQIKQS